MAEAQALAPRRRLRLGALLLTAAVAVLYVVVFLVQLPHMQEIDNPAPAYLALAALYVVGLVLQVVRDTRVTYWVGAAVQAVLIGAFAWLLMLLYSNGDESFIFDMAWLAIAINAAQVVLMGVLGWLAIHTPRHRAEQVPAPDSTPGLDSTPSRT